MDLLEGDVMLLFKSRFPRQMINEIKWKGFDLSRCKIHYENRGAHNDVSIVTGDEIRNIDSMFLILEGDPWEKYIPYHRIFKIEYDNEIVFEHY